MKSKLGLVALVLGGFLVVFAALSKFYVYDRLAVAPLDVESTTISETAEGQDATILIARESTSEPQTTALKSVRVTQADPELSEQASEALDADIAVYDTFSQLDTPDFDFGGGTEASISGSRDIVAFDRKTGEAVEWSGTRSWADGEETRGARFEGLYFKFPFDVQQETYQFWDGTIQRATDIEFDGETEIDGLSVYRFVQTIDDEFLRTMDVPGSMLGGDESSPGVTTERYYSNTRTLYIEPETGAIIRGGEDQRQWVVAPDGTEVEIVNAQLEYTAETIAESVEDQQGNAAGLTLFRSTVPLVGSILGVILIVVGAVLFVTGRPARPAHAEQP